MINSDGGLQPLNRSLSGLPQWVSKNILQQIDQLFAFHLYGILTKGLSQTANST